MLAPGREEYLNSEKYEYRPRDYDAEPNLNVLLGTLNAIRDRHPALQQLRQIEFHTALNDRVIAYSKHDGDDAVITICSLDQYNVVESDVYLDLAAVGLAGRDSVRLRDELTGATFTWGERNFVRLTPANPAHVLHVLD